MNGFWIRNASQGLGLFSIATLLLYTQAYAGDDPWADIKTDVVGSRTIIENDGVVSLDAPVRAEDPALVPISMKVTPGTGLAVHSLALIIDGNPSPVAAKFTFGPAAGKNRTEQLIATRVRVDSYTFVRAIAETSDGNLHMARKFVKASGGCSAPAPKDMATALKDMGKILIKNVVHTDIADLREVQVMLKHPNLNGMQMDPVTRFYARAKFVKQLTIKYGGELVFDVESGISIASDPNIRFTYNYSGQKPFTVTAVDTDNSIFASRGRTSRVVKQSRTCKNIWI
jgi:sulfur-oxidizing protein SoxY